MDPGDEFEGEWRYGMESGAGTFTKSDGARFYGFWLRGQRHGEGVSFVHCHKLGLRRHLA